jgi:hypothetical protein
MLDMQRCLEQTLSPGIFDTGELCAPSVHRAPAGTHLTHVSATEPFPLIFQLGYCQLHSSH